MHGSAIFVALVTVNCSVALAVADPVLAVADPGVAEADGLVDVPEFTPPVVEAELVPASCPVTWTSFPISVRTLSRLPVSL